MDRNNLIKLVDFISEISEIKENKWFLDLLKSRFTKYQDFDIESNDSIESKINLIKDYLSIDIKRVIDYSSFDEPSREFLFRDCIEMGRFEKGTPNHKIDYGEFCRHAHLQAEEMINYFFNKTSNMDIKKIDLFIQEKVSSYKPTRMPSEVHHIFYTHKLSAFKSISKLTKKSVDVFWFLNDFRNELSHRNSLSINTEDKDLIEYERLGFSNSQIDFNNLDYKRRQIYNRGKYVITKRKKDFNIIYESLEELKKQIIETKNSINELPVSKPTIGSANPILQEIKNKLNQ